MWIKFKTCGARLLASLSEWRCPDRALASRLWCHRHFPPVVFDAAPPRSTASLSYKRSAPPSGALPFFFFHEARALLSALASTSTPPVPPSAHHRADHALPSPSSKSRRRLGALLRKLKRREELPWSAGAVRSVRHRAPRRCRLPPPTPQPSRPTHELCPIHILLADSSIDAGDPWPKTSLASPPLWHPPPWWTLLASTPKLGSLLHRHALEPSPSRLITGKLLAGHRHYWRHLERALPCFWLWDLRPAQVDWVSMWSWLMCTVSFVIFHLI
jgi:hypothetical protein